MAGAGITVLVAVAVVPAAAPVLIVIEKFLQGPVALARAAATSLDCAARPSLRMPPLVEVATATPSFDASTSGSFCRSAHADGVIVALRVVPWNCDTACRN